MTDQNDLADLSPADVDAAREWAKTIAAANRVAYTDPARAAARAVLAAYPAPPRPTLADMNDEERKECLRMQADVVNHTERYVIVNPHDRHGDAVVIDDDGGIEWFLPDLVTPRPDLRRMEWPGTEKPAPALPDGWRLAEHQRNGRVIVTNPTPNSDGRVYYVLPSDDPLGYDWLFCDPDDLTYLDQ